MLSVNRSTSSTDQTGHSISPDGRYLALVERHSSIEHVGLYDQASGCELIRVRHSPSYVPSDEVQHHHRPVVSNHS